MKTFETEGDVHRQEMAGRRIGTALGLWVVSTPPLATLDYELRTTAGEIVGYGEYKRRRHTYGQFPTVFMSLLKFHALWEASMKGLTGYYFVEFDDGIYFTTLEACLPAKVTLRGRSSAREEAPHDVEPILEIPIRRFSPLVRTG